jgi:hypothetical protein
METAAQSVHALNHSYTNMPVISMDGSLFSHLYFCLLEAKGTFGPHVQQSMFTTKNLIIDASYSGKLGKSNIHCFFHDTFFSYCDKKSLLFVNPWSVYSDVTVLELDRPPRKVWKQQKFHQEQQEVFSHWKKNSFTT